MQMPHRVLICSAIDRYLGSFQFLTSMNMMLFTFQGVSFSGPMSSFLLGLYLGALMPGHRVFTGSSIGRNDQFPKVFVSNYFHPTESEGVSDPCQ